MTSSQLSRGEGDSTFMGPLPAVAGCDCHICRPDESYAADDRRSIDAVLEHGWQVILVSDAAECSCSEHDHEHDQHAHEVSAEPDFAYTVGLGHRCGHPELLMSGLDPALMHRALNNVAARVMAGRRLAPGDVLEGVLGGVPVVVERVSEAVLGDTVLWSGWFHRRKPEALMLFWPTTSGIFDWQPGAPQLLSERQPRAWREPVEHAGGVATDPEWVFPVPADLLAFTCTHVLDDGEPILWVARETDPERGEDWSLHCGAAGHRTDDMRLAHISHLVRAAPSVTELAGMRLDHEGWRDDPDSPWQSRAIDEE